MMVNISRYAKLLPVAAGLIATPVASASAQDALVTARAAEDKLNSLKWTGPADPWSSARLEQRRAGYDSSGKGIETTLDCGYTYSDATASQVIPDPALDSRTTIGADVGKFLFGDNAGATVQVMAIDDKAGGGTMVIAATGLGVDGILRGASPATVHYLDGKGALIANACTIDPNDSTLSNCAKTAPTLKPDYIVAAGQAVHGSCGIFVQALDKNWRAGKDPVYSPYAPDPSYIPDNKAGRGKIVSYQKGLVAQLER